MAAIALLVLVAISAYAHSIDLTSLSVRSFEPGHIPGPWDRDDPHSSSKCPSLIRYLGYHTTRSGDVYTVRHWNIEQDHVGCAGSGQMVFISKEAMENPEKLVGVITTQMRRAIGRLLLSDQQYMDAVESLSESGINFYGVLETSTRTCGSTSRFETGTQGFLLSTDKITDPEAIPTIPQFSGARLPPRELHMALFEPGPGGRRCLYHALMRTPKKPFKYRPKPSPSPKPRKTSKPKPLVNSTKIKPTVSPSVSPSISPTPTNDPIPPPIDDGSDLFGSVPYIGSRSRTRSCFPSFATVTLRDGRTARMDKLQIGDEVHVGSGQFSRVFLFTHRDASIDAEFIRLHTTCGHTLLATPGHFIYVDNKLTLTDNAQVGSSLTLADGSRAFIDDVTIVQDRGLYNPQTAQGNIVVDGVLVSTYTEVVAPKAAHPLLLPIRAVAAALCHTTGSA